MRIEKQTKGTSAQPIGGHRKDAFIQVWRGIAVVLVVYYHFADRLPYTVMGSNVPPILRYYSGEIGVLVFFVISGYLITKSLLASRDLASFYAKRISRIWPLFIFASIFIYIFVKVVNPPIVTSGPKHFNNEPRHIYDLIGTVLFLGDLGFKWVDGAFWSVLVELKFYFWIGLMAALSPDRFVRNFSIASLIIGTAEIALEILRLPGGQILNGLFIAQYLPFFAIGCLLFVDDHKELLTVNVILAVVQAGIEISSNQEFEMVGTAVFGLCLILLVSIDALALRSRVFINIGDYSYAWYLFHQMIGLSLIRLITPTVGINFAILGAIFITYLLCVICSWAAEWRFRTVFYRALNRLFSLIGFNRLRLSPVTAREA